MSVSSADLIDEQKASYQKACYRRNKPSARSSRPAPLKKDDQITKKRNQITQTTTQTTQTTRSTRSTRSTKSNTTYQAFAGHVFCSIASRTTCDGGTSGAAPSLCCIQLWSQTGMSAGGGGAPTTTAAAEPPPGGYRFRRADSWGPVFSGLRLFQSLLQEGFGVGVWLGTWGCSWGLGFQGFFGGQVNQSMKSQGLLSC